jgi:hypothetical protein
MQIRDLEDELDVLLFERTGKALNLTDAGHLFLREARVVLERTGEAVKKVRAFARAGETELHVGYSPTLRAQIVSPTLRAFQREMPKLHVKLHDLSNGKMVTGLREGRLHWHSWYVRQNAVGFARRTFRMRFSPSDFWLPVLRSWLTSELRFPSARLRPDRAASRGLAGSG